MSAMTVIVTATPARFAAVTAASGIGIAPATAHFGMRVVGGRMAGFSGYRADILPLTPLRTDARR